jgi:hypothetical protein
MLGSSRYCRAVGALICIAALFFLFSSRFASAQSGFGEESAPVVTVNPDHSITTTTTIGHAECRRHVFNQGGRNVRQRLGDGYVFRRRCSARLTAANHSISRKSRRSRRRFHTKRRIT